MKAFQKVLSLLLILCLIVAVCPVLTAYAETNDLIVRDEFGSGFNYVYNKYHALLVIHGEGPLVLPDPQPWDEYEGEIRRIILDEGITSVPAGAFSGCGKLASVVFPTTLETVDPDAFADCNVVSFATTMGSTTALRSLLKDAGIDAFRGAEFTRVSRKSLADEISNLESDDFLTDYYYPIEDKRTLEEKKWQAFMDYLDSLKNKS